MSELSAEGLFKRFDVSGLVWAELTDGQRAWWEEHAEALAPTPAVQLAAIAKPGDTILVGYDHRLSDKKFQEMTDRLRSIGEELGVQFGVIEGASSVTIVRPEVSDALDDARE
jgi:hypothetical protein